MSVRQCNGARSGRLTGSLHINQSARVENQTQTDGFDFRQPRADRHAVPDFEIAGKKLSKIVSTHQVMTWQFAGPISRTNEPANAAALLQLGPYYCCESNCSLYPWQKLLQGSKNHAVLMTFRTHGPWRTRVRFNRCSWDKMKIGYSSTFIIS